MLDEAAVRAAVAEHGPAGGASFYLCGPAPFMAPRRGALGAAGVPEERVRVERFVFTPHVNDPAPPARRMGPRPRSSSRCSLAAKEHRLRYVPGKTLLQTARDDGLDAPYSCEEGFCGCCASNLLEGRVVMAADDALSAAEKKQGMILACQSRPVTRRCKFQFVG